MYSLWFSINKRKNTICNINGKKYDLSYILDFYKEHPDGKVKLIGNFRKMSNCSLSDAKKGYWWIIETNEIPKSLILQQRESNKIIEEDNKVHCPYCNSTNIKKITIGSKVAHTALFGIFSMSRIPSNGIVTIVKVTFSRIISGNRRVARNCCSFYFGYFISPT